MTDFSIFRIYEPHELKNNRYPFAWDRLPTEKVVAWAESKGLPVAPDIEEKVFGIKHLVRLEAGERCIRCGHPYLVGESGVWEHLDRPSDLTSTRFDSIDMSELPIDEPKAGRPHRILWSPCDEYCTHGEPIRGAVIRLDETAGALVRKAKLYGVDTRIEAAWRILTVHHLNERKEDCRWHNLVALCQRCLATSPSSARSRWSRCSRSSTQSGSARTLPRTTPTPISAKS